MTNIFKNVHLSISSNHTFEIDTLIISERYVLIVEVKNLKDTVRFVKNPPHLKQTLKNGDEAVLNCPVYQTETNKLNLNEWFRQHGISLKTQGLIVLANQNTIVEDAPDDFPIIYKKQIPYYLQNLLPDNVIFSGAELENISRQIQHEQQRFNPFPLCSYFNIDASDLRKGLLCHHCNGILIKKNRETWYCEFCSKDVLDPFNDGIKDWLLLVKSSITNKECRDFLSLKNSNAARYALSKSPLVKKGKSTATFYISGNKRVPHE